MGRVNAVLHSAPKARDVKAWVNGQDNGGIAVKALKARNKYWSAVKDGLIFALSALRDLPAGYLGRCPKGVTLRTLGAA